ncbi:MAG: OmpW family outer membrane protein [bacterium]
MKKTICWLAVFAILFVPSLSGKAAQSVLDIKAGTFNPKDAKAGLLIGISTGKQVDERVDFGIGMDLFVRQFTQETAIEAEIGGQSQSQLVQKEIDYSLFALPLMLRLNFYILPDLAFTPYVGLGGGYEILFSREANYITGEKDSRLYGGFGWQAWGGVQYQLGSNSALIAEVLYNGCTVKRGKGSSDLGFPVHEELDFSGLGFRAGVRLGGF